ncbi:MAG: hypothetical protein HY928_04480 [Elusimicrobia bacterium]|nr:hypothetical protein [Elusimicrobiota bacterium]
MILGAALAVLACAPAGPARAQGESAPVGQVTFKTLNVFDLDQPEDDWWPFVMANRIHLVTRPAVVRREMLLAPGDPFDPLKAIETERNLRTLGFIRHAAVLPTARSDGAVDLQVRTQDSWTLQPRLSIGTEGGETSTVLGVSEGNILGLGKQVSAFHSRTGSRRRNELRYGDPRLVGTEGRLLTHFADTDRGNEVGVRLHRPFYSHDSPWAAEASWAKVAQDETLYRDASQVNEFLHDYRSARALASLRLAQGSSVVHRGGAGWRFERSRFDAQTRTLPGALPSRRTLSGPLAAYALIEPRYHKAVDIDRMKVIEDFNLGWELGVEGSPLLDATGSDRDRWGLGASLQKGLALGEGRFALAQAVTESRMAGGRIDNGILTGSLNLFWQTTMRYRQTFVTHAEYTATKALDAERQLSMGGDTGLRGYRNNAFQGARVMTVNLEDRLFFDRNVMRLMYFGAVAFLEAGSAIPDGARFGRAPWKADLGLGLRISSSRSAAGGVLRIDGAYALNRGPGGSRWVLTLKGGQAFSLGGSANKPLLRKPDAILADDSPSDRLRRR